MMIVAIVPPPWSIIAPIPIQGVRKRQKLWVFEPLTSAFGGRRAIIKPMVTGHYNGRLKKVDEK
jgi:hypothetical protein